LSKLVWHTGGEPTEEEGGGGGGVGSKQAELHLLCAA